MSFELGPLNGGYIYMEEIEINGIISNILTIYND